MVNLNKLKGKLTEKELTYIKCAEVLDVTVATFCKKMNGKTKFTVEEANDLSRALGLTNEEKIEIFLA